MISIRYARALVIPRRLPPALLKAALACDEAFQRRLGAGRLQLYRRQVAAGRMAPCYVAAAPGMGRGLFARRALARGRLIGEYTGVLTRRWTLGAAKINPYLLRYPFASRYAIDARRRGNETRFINHSPRPNVARVYLLVGGVLRCAFIAARAIRKDEQLFLDYGKRYWRKAQLPRR